MSGVSLLPAFALVNLMDNPRDNGKGCHRIVLCRQSCWGDIPESLQHGTSTYRIESANAVDRNDCGAVVQLCHTLKHMGDALEARIDRAYWPTSLHRSSAEPLSERRRYVTNDGLLTKNLRQTAR